MHVKVCGTALHLMGSVFISFWCYIPFALDFAVSATLPLNSLTFFSVIFFILLILSIFIKLYIYISHSLVYIHSFWTFSLKHLSTCIAVVFKFIKVFELKPQSLCLLTVFTLWLSTLGHILPFLCLTCGCYTVDTVILSSAEECWSWLLF